MVRLCQKINKKLCSLLTEHFLKKNFYKVGLLSVFTILISDLRPAKHKKFILSSQPDDFSTGKSVSEALILE